MVGRSQNVSQTIRASVLIGPATVVVVIMFIFPLLYFLRNSFNKYVPGQIDETAWTLENFISFFTDTYFLTILQRTIWISLFSTILTLIIAFPIAYFVARMRSKWKAYIIILIAIPLLVGSIIRDIGWMTLLEKSGVINELLFAIGIIDEPLPLIRTPLAVIIGITNVVLPYMVLVLQSVLESISPTLEEAAFDLKASRFTMFRTIIIPLAVPGIMIGTLFVFVLSMNAYTTPLILGGPKVSMMAVELYSQISQSNNWPMGSAMAVILIGITLITAVLYLSVMNKLTSKMSSGSGVKG